MPEDIQDYFRSTASQMKARLDIIKGIVIQGRERNVPVGDACENALRSVLRDSLPTRFGVATGLVYTGKTPPGSVQSKPLDVIIFDALHYAPIYRDGDFVVVTDDNPPKLSVDIETIPPIGNKDKGRVLSQSANDRRT